MGTIPAASISLLVVVVDLGIGHGAWWRFFITVKKGEIMDNLNELVLVAALLIGVAWWAFGDSTSC